MDDIFDLPTDFVENSKPSEILENLYQRKEKALNETLKNHHEKIKGICEKYAKLFEIESDELKKKLDEFRTYINSDIFDSKIKCNQDNATTLEKNHFRSVYKRILGYTKQQSQAIDEFHAKQVQNEKDKAREFTAVLKTTYNEIKTNCYKLPYERDELIDLEMEKMNQTILCNNQNYSELKFTLQTECQCYTRNAIQELQYIKEIWLRFLTCETDMRIKDLRSHYMPTFIKTVEVLTDKSLQFRHNISKSESLMIPDYAAEWLKDIRTSLANIDHNAKSIIINYKQAAILIYNRIFEELKTIPNDYPEIQFDTNQLEMYTPSIDEIKHTIDAELDELQMKWSELVDQLKTTMEIVQHFLNTTSTLWAKHFRRIEILQIIVEKDVELQLKKNNTFMQRFDIKLNILLDTLRQESSKDKCKKTLEKILKLMDDIEVEYSVQYQQELSMLKKFKTIIDLEVDTLLAELRRFLEVYPPDKEKDPKIQRKRASQTDQVISVDNLIPDQMLYTKYQVDAMSNWQFGVWEAIQAYLKVARTEVNTEFDKCLQIHANRLEYRKNIRVTIHRTRLETIEAYFYETRLKELCVHQSRLEEHKLSVSRGILHIKEDLKLLQTHFEEILTNYQAELKGIEDKILKATNSVGVASIQPIMASITQEHLEKVESIIQNYRDKCTEFNENVKTAHVKLLQSLKLFSEGGNFSAEEVKSILKDIDKTEPQVETSMENVKRDAQTYGVAINERILTFESELRVIWKGVLEEQKFKELIEKRKKTMQDALVAEVCSVQSTQVLLKQQCEIFKTDCERGCGKSGFIKTFTTSTQNAIRRIKESLAYMAEVNPIRVYSQKPAKMSLETATSTSTGKTKLKHDIIAELTHRLFDFEIVTPPTTYFHKLSHIMQTTWNDAVTDIKEFYNAHHKLYILETDPIYTQAFHVFSHIYQIFLNVQTQCETRVMQDTIELICFIYPYINYLREYIQTAYIDCYTYRSINLFKSFLEVNVEQFIKDSKTRVTDQFSNLQMRLKPSYGHPKNRKLLEKLQIEAETLYCESKENLANIKQPLLKEIDEKFSRVQKEYGKFQNYFVEIEKELTNLEGTTNELNIQLNEKVTLLRKFVVQFTSESSVTNQENVINHCKSILSLFDAQSICDLKRSCEEIKSHITSLSGSSESSTIRERHLEIQESTDSFLADVQEFYNTCVDTVKQEDMETFVEVLKAEWWCATKKVLDLYNLKYDVGS